MLVRNTVRSALSLIALFAFASVASIAFAQPRQSVASAFSGEM